MNMTFFAVSPRVPVGEGFSTSAIVAAPGVGKIVRDIAAA